VKTPRHAGHTVLKHALKHVGVREAKKIKQGFEVGITIFKFGETARRQQEIRIRSGAGAKKAVRSHCVACGSHC
jgi:hypothetical protein